MSKKKAFSGNTMTLKDFHGGSIPSDLPLPSAPGVNDRISDRPVYDHRPLPWGANPTGRAADQRSRLTSSSSSSTRHFDDTSSFLSLAAPIGRNFDEDERKPLDGLPLGPRPTVGDDGGVWVVSELKRHQHLQPQPQSPLYAAGRLSSQQQQVHDVVSSRGNNAAAWSLKKEGVSASQPVQSASAASIGVSKLIYASAIEKVTSGRWHSRQKQSTHYEAEEVLNATTGFYGDEMHSCAIAVGENRTNTSSEEIHRKGKATQLAGAHFDASAEKKIITPLHIGGAFHGDVRVASTDPQYPVVAQESERPKLKLLPRSKLSDQSYVGHKQQAVSQVNQKPVDHPHSEFISQVHGSAQLPAQVAVTESASQMVERPKLNLKPRSQPLKQSQGIAYRDRTTVYGGGRPRELVLKDRKVDDVKSYERSGYDSRSSKINKKKVEHDEKRCWRNQEERRAPSPEIWRKSVVVEEEQEESGIRFGKAASAAELAQAFSRSCSVAPNKFNAQRLPFSRLIGGGGGAAAAAQTSTTSSR